MSQIEKFMDVESVLFKIFNEFILLHELYEKLSREQAGSIVESVIASFSELPIETIERYKLFLKESTEQEHLRGSFERANVLEDLSASFDIDN